MATHSSTLAWQIPWTEEPDRLQSMGSRSRTQLSDFTFTFHFYALEKEMATHSSVLAWRIPGMAEPGGLPSMGSHSQSLKRLSSSNRGMNGRHSFTHINIHSHSRLPALHIRLPGKNLFVFWPKKKKKRKQLGIQEGSKFLWFFLPYNHLCKRHPKMWVLDGVYCEHCNTEHSAIKSCWN